MTKHKFLKLNETLMIVTGLRPITFDNKVITRFHLIYSNFMIVASIILVISGLYLIYDVGKDNFFEIDTNLWLYLYYISNIMKLWSARSKNMTLLLNNVLDSEPKMLDGNVVVLKLFKKYFRYNGYATKSLLTLGTPCIGFYVLPPLFRENTSGDEYAALPGGNAIPFNMIKPYYLAYFIQSYASVTSLMLIISTNSILYGTMLFGVLRLKYLQYRLKHFKSDGEKLALKLRLPKQDGISLALHECILLHKEIIRYVNILNETIRGVMLLDFGILSTEIGIFGFKLVTQEKRWNSLLYLTASLTVLYCYYSIANEISLESEKVSKVAWESQWEDCELDVKRSLILMMVRSQRSLKLTIGLFGAMSLDSFLSIVQGCYSYIALLIRVYSR